MKLRVYQINGQLMLELPSELRKIGLKDGDEISAYSKYHKFTLDFSPIINKNSTSKITYNVSAKLYDKAKKILADKYCLTVSEYLQQCMKFVAEHPKQATAWLKNARKENQNASKN